jgi:hypothetical protein
MALVGVVVGLTATTASADPAAAPAAQDPLCSLPGHAAPITAGVRLTHDVDCGTGAVVFDVSATIDLAGHTLRAGFIDALVFGFNPPPIDASITSGRLVLTGGKRNVDGGALHLERVAVSGRVGLLEGSVSIDRSIVEGGVGLDGGDPGRAGVHITDSLVLGGVTSGGGDLLLHHDAITGGVFTDEAGRGVPLSVEDNVVVGGITAVEETGLGPDIAGDISHNLIVAGSIFLTGFLQEFGPTAIDHNLVIGSKDSGISVTQDSPVLPRQPADAGPITLTGNVAVANQGHGIDAEWPSGVPNKIVDGGENMAFLNRTQPECVGVSCRAGF